MSLAILSSSVTKVKYTLFLFSRITVSPSLRLREFTGMLFRKRRYFNGYFQVRLPQHEDTPVKQKLIRATELAEFVYCSKAWQPKYLDGAEVSPVARELQAEAMHGISSRADRLLVVTGTAWQVSPP